MLQHKIDHCYKNATVIRNGLPKVQQYCVDNMVPMEHWWCPCGVLHEEVAPQYDICLDAEMGVKNEKSLFMAKITTLSITFGHMISHEICK